MAQSSLKKYRQSSFVSFIKSNKKTVACYLGFVALMILQALYCSYALMNAGSTRVGLVYIFALGLVLIAFLTYAFKTERLKQSTIYLIFLLTLGILFLFLFAPLKAPDEVAHYQVSYWLSNHLLGDWQEGLPMRVADIEFFNRWTDLYSLNKKDYLILAEGINTTNYSITNFNETYKASLQNFPLHTYFLSSVGLSAARILGLDPAIAYYLARTMSFLGYAACAYVAFRNTPIGKPVFAILSMFPLVLELATSLSYDGMTIGIAMVLTAFCFKGIFAEGKQRPTTLIVIFVFAILIVPCKVIYSTIILLALFIPNKTFKSKKLAVIYKCAILFACAIVFGATKLEATTSVASSNTAGTTVETWKTFTIGDFINDPLRCVLMYLNTFINVTSDRVVQFSGYALGALNMTSHNSVIFSLIYLLLICIAFLRISDKNKKPSRRLKILCFACFLITYILIDTSMLLGHTRFDSNVIQGVQGRYYYPAALLLIPVFLNTRFSSNTIGTDKLIICSAGTSILYAMDIYTLVMTAV